MCLLRLFLICGCVGGLSMQSYAQLLPDSLAPVLLHPASRTLALPVQVQVTDTQAFRLWIRTHLPRASAFDSGISNLLTMSPLTATERQLLLTCPSVIYIDAPTRVPREEIEVDKRDLSVNALVSLSVTYPQWTGRGVAVSVKENPFDSSDIDFRGRIIATQGSFAKAPGEHATIMTTIIAGAGNTSPQGKGIAWQARIATADFARLLPDNIQTLTTTGVSVQNHSYGMPAVENYYGVESAAYDQQCAENEWLLHVFSAGNEGVQTPVDGQYAGIARMANLTGQFKTSKNTLSVGAIDGKKQLLETSSRGPAHDGRIKPELVAYGQSGTSEAAAVVSGTALLIQQAYKNQFGTLPSAALVKALLITTAEDIGRPQVDFETGYGNMHALKAVQALTKQQFAQAGVQEGQNQTGTIQIPAGVHACKVTLAWHDLPAQPGAGKALINDLDLELTQVSTGKKWLPWVLHTFPRADSLQLPARRGIDRLNTSEQITLELPEAGTYTWTVRGFAVTGTQAFHVAYAFENEFEWLSPVSGYVLQSLQPNRIRWQYTGTEMLATLAYRQIGTTHWIPIHTTISLRSGYADWTPPATLGLASVLFQLTTGNRVYTSDTCVVSGSLAVQVGYACDDKGLIYWAPDPAATQYQVFRLGKEFLEPVAVTSDTVWRIDARMPGSAYYAVAGQRGGQQGLKSKTIDYQLQEVGCYIETFAARKLTTDSVMLDLKLGTVLDLQTVVLERKERNGYRAIQTMVSAQSVFFSWADPSPSPGLNSYRVRLVTQEGQVIYSETEDVYYVPNQQLYIYPNPLSAPDTLFIRTTTEEAVRIRLYNLQGQLMWEIPASGSFMALPVSGVGAGLYVLHVQTGNKVRIARIIVR